MNSFPRPQFLCCTHRFSDEKQRNFASSCSRRRREHRFSLLCRSYSSSQVAAPNVVDILTERGLVKSITNDNLRLACSNPNIPLKVYCGFDPTAESLHLGNLIGLIVLAWFQRCGHNTVALIGGATARIGDPSGKSKERPELDKETIYKNSAEISAQIHQILRRASVDRILNSDSNGSGDCFLVLNSWDWWKGMGYFDFFELVGKYSSIETMLKKKSVNMRLMSKQSINYCEFSYQLIQGYDFVYMFKNIGVNVQIGGSDQWGNIVTGIYLIRKILGVKGAYGLTFPLLLKSDGSKFGKSESGAIWLSPHMLSPHKFYKYFFSVPDEDVLKFMKILTFLSLEEIQEVEEYMKMPDYISNSAQRKLAEEVTRLVHGEEELVEVLKAT